MVNKARGMVVHPAPGHPAGTLVNALLWHCGDSLSGIGGEKRPGIVHKAKQIVAPNVTKATAQVATYCLRMRKSPGPKKAGAKK